MKITKIELEAGTDQTAVLTRERGSDHITVEIATPGHARTHNVQADDRGDVWSMAECLHQTLEGFRGCRGDVQPYFAALEQMADL